MHVYLVLGLFPPHGLYLGLLVYLICFCTHTWDNVPLLVMDWCSSSEVSARPGLLFLLVLPWLVAQSPFSVQELSVPSSQVWVWLREVCFGETFTWQVPTKATRHLIDSHFTFFFFLMFRVPSCSTFLEWYMESIRTKRFTTWADLLLLWSLDLSHGKHLIRTSWQTGKL